MTRQEFIKNKFEILNESIKSLSEQKERMLNKAMNSSSLAASAKTKEVATRHKLDEFNANLERDCIKAKLTVIENELKLLTNDLIEETK